MELDKETLKAYSRAFTKALLIVLLGSLILTIFIYFWPAKPVSFAGISWVFLIVLTGLGCLALIYENNWDTTTMKKQVLKKGSAVGVALLFCILMAFFAANETHYYAPTSFTVPLILLLGLSLTYGFYVFVGMTAVIVYAYYIKSPPFAIGMIISVFVAAVSGTQGVATISNFITSDPYYILVALPIAIAGFKWKFGGTTSSKYLKHIRDTTVRTVGLLLLALLFTLFTNAIAQSSGGSYLGCLNNLNYVGQAGCKANFIAFTVGLTLFLMGIWLIMINLFDGRLYDLEPHVENIKASVADYYGYFVLKEGQLMTLENAESMLREPAGWWTERALSGNIFPGSNPQVMKELGANKDTKGILIARETFRQKITDNYPIFLRNYATLRGAIEASSEFQNIVTARGNKSPWYLTGLLLTASGFNDWQANWINAYREINNDGEIANVLRLGQTFSERQEAIAFRNAYGEVKNARDTITGRIEDFLNSL